MIITKNELAQARRVLFAPTPRDRRQPYAVDFKIRPISVEWRLVDKMPAFKTATCNVAYIWRDSDVADHFGPMPAAFAQRRAELHGAGLLLPANAPLWATEGYRVWQEADDATFATNDPTEVSAWHMIGQIPETVSPAWWRWMCTGFLQSQLVDRGAAVAWAIHGLQGADGEWLVSPHFHAICTARRWKTGPKKGQRHPQWIATWEQQRRLGAAWRGRCATAGLMKQAGFGWSTLPIMP